MSNFHLASILDDAEKSADASFALGKAAIAELLNVPQTAGEVVGSGMLGLGGRYTQGGGVETHAEQLRHYRGRVYSASRPIVHRIAAQPLRVARLAKTKRTKTGFARPTKDFLPRSCKDMAGQLEVLPEHMIYDVMADPNRLMLSTTLRVFTVAGLLLTGKGYWWMKAPSKGKPAPRQRVGVEKDYETQWQVWPFPSSWIQPWHEKDKPFSHWRVVPYYGGRPFDIPAEEIVYFSLPDPADPFRAIGPLQAGAKSVVSHESINDAQRRSFHRPFPGLMLTIGRHPDARDSDVGGGNERPILTAEQRRQIETWVNAMWQGVEDHNRPLIIDALIEKAELLMRSPREMDFMRSNEVAMKQIDETFGTNPIIMGRVEGANRSSAVVAEENFLSNTVNPLIEMMSEAMTAWLSPRLAPGENLYIYIEPAVARDADYNLRRTTAIVQSGVGFLNEVRSQYDLDPVPGGDSILVTPQGLVPFDGNFGVTEGGAGGTETVTESSSDVIPGESGDSQGSEDGGAAEGGAAEGGAAEGGAAEGGAAEGGAAEGGAAEGGAGGAGGEGPK